MLKPDPVEAATINSDVERRLRSAFRYLISDIIGLPDQAEIARCSPAAYALQDLMRAAAERADADAIRQLYAAHSPVLSQAAAPGADRIVPWSADHLSPSEITLLQSAFRDDIGITESLVAPAPKVTENFRRDHQTVARTLGAHLPGWWREIDAFIGTIYLAQGADGSVQFGGASAFAAWGGVLINPASIGTPLSLALALVHECSHLKLFSAYIDDEITLNDPAARYTSPLRREGRPMNGLYHATFVLARMIRFLHDLAASDAPLDTWGADARAQLAGALSQNARAFAAAHAEVSEHGVLTARGAAILDEAAAAVSECTRTGRAA